MAEGSDLAPLWPSLSVVGPALALAALLSAFTLPFSMLARCRLRPPPLLRSLHSTPLRHRELFDPTNVERPTDDVDVCIVGAGPAGLSAAIRLKQLEQQHGREVRVVVLEKGAEVGQRLSRPPLSITPSTLPRFTHSLRRCHRAPRPQ